MGAFLRSKGRLTVSRRQATVLNTLNLLAPTLLGLTVLLAIAAKVGGFAAETRQALNRCAVGLILVAVLVRVGWGICVFVLRRGQVQKT